MLSISQALVYRSLEFRRFLAEYPQIRHCMAWFLEKQETQRTGTDQFSRALKVVKHSTPAALSVPFILRSTR